MSKGQRELLGFVVLWGNSPASVYLTPSSTHENVCVGVRRIWGSAVALSHKLFVWE